VTDTGELLAEGWKCQRAGNAAQAESFARQVLQRDPDNADAFHLLGVSFHSRRRLDEAVHCYEQILRKHPIAQVCSDLGTARAMQGRLDRAIVAFERGLQLDPSSAEIRGNLANALRLQGRLPEAIADFEQALRLKPTYAEGHFNLGLALLTQGRPAQAIECFLQALRIQPQLAAALNALRQTLALYPDYPQAHYNLGNVLARVGRFEEALAAYRQALKLDPALVEAHNNLASTLCRLGRLDEAVAAYRETLRLNPTYAEAHFNLGVTLADLGKPDEARACYDEALRLKPNYAEAWNNLAHVLLLQGFAQEAVEANRQAVAAASDRQEIHSNLLLSLHYPDVFDPAAIFEDHLRWGKQFPAVPAPRPTKPNPERRLRIGYVSGDFWQHVVGNAMETILAAHDHADFEVFCYANLFRIDAVTDRIKKLADHWRPIHGSPDTQVADLIRQDQIDVLVDLSGHTAGNRLGVFGLRPGPIQITHLGYACTTGLPAMDYRLTDAYSDPPGRTEHLHCEKLIRLPQVRWCYRPFTDARPDPVRLGETDAITFACLNKQSKVTEPMIGCWARILDAVPTARLLLLTGDGQTAHERVKKALARHQVSPERVTLLGRQSAEEYYQTYQRVDICLDTYPFTGLFTTVDALWMGVPVVSLAGPAWHSRQGVGPLTLLGLEDLVVDTLEAYQETAIRLAQDRTRLRDLRNQVRARLEDSPLLDTTGFTRNLETVYRTLWQRACGESGEKM
jgi:predicted O-linked N-acetylglucosamine transferase (SPINDLY family)